MYRKEIKVMDCTVRDGGLMNNWQFSDEFVRAVYKSCVEAGIDYMEIGYKSSESAFSRDEVGPWKFCDDKDLRRSDRVDFSSLVHIIRASGSPKAEGDCGEDSEPQGYPSADSD